MGNADGINHSYVNVQNQKKGFLRLNEYYVSEFHLHHLAFFMIMFSLLFVTSIFLSSTEQEVIAQIIIIEGLEPYVDVTTAANSNENVTKLDIMGTQTPIVEKITDKGLYGVQLRWNPDPAVLLPREGFIITTYFIDPNIAKQVLQPGSYSVLPLVPVESYDITITSDDGSILWENTNQMPAGGRVVERVIFEKEYTGPITIELSDITSRDRGTDSVTFNARVIED